MAVWRGFHVVLRRIDVRSCQDECRRELAPDHVEAAELRPAEVAQGAFNFSTLERLLAAPHQEEGEEEPWTTRPEDVTVVHAIAA